MLFRAGPSTTYRPTPLSILGILVCGSPFWRHRRERTKSRCFRRFDLRWTKNMSHAPNEPKTENRKLKTDNRNREAVSSSPWMGGVVGFFEALDCNVSVDLCCREIGMPQQGLNAAQVGAVVEEMGGETVPELVRSNAQLD